MTGSGNLFLGIIAVSVLLMAVLQLAAILFLARYARRLMGITEDLQREMRPLLAKVSAIADEAQRAAALATKQVERVDALVGDLSRRIHETTRAIQSIVTGPVRQGSMVVSALRGVIAALLTSRPARRFDRDDEDDALFVG
ncbi:MAG: hypothetical protein WD690_17850 [Vicinamibacterales bacterium]